MDDSSTLEAVASILHSIAEHISLQHELKSNHVLRLPGVVSAAKSNLEFEIATLIGRVQTLEAKVIIADTQALPDTPDELGRSSIFTDSRTGGSSGSLESAASSEHPVSQPPTFSGSYEERPHQAIMVAEGDTDVLRECADVQSQHFKSQMSVLSVEDSQLCRQQQLQDRTIRLAEAAHTSTLERGLKKHQQANEAFQKALREIGEIITAVARGDLSKKLQIHSTEMDPEITTFKMVHPSTPYQSSALTVSAAQVINTMVDQLQIFSSEVSRVAREVGTEGKLGGQARIIGVDGTWKELTNNGLSSPCHWVRAARAQYFVTQETIC
jgi:osomolarity two-component system, sensor histidine kinase NIK1